MLRRIKAIAASHGSSFALLSDGMVWAWGSAGTIQPGTIAVRVAGLTDVIAISVLLVVKADGTVWQTTSVVVDRKSRLTGVVAVAGPGISGTRWDRLGMAQQSVRRAGRGNHRDPNCAGAGA